MRNTITHPLLRKVLISDLDFLGDLKVDKQNLGADDWRGIDTVDSELDGLLLFDRDASEAIGRFLYDQVEAEAVNEFAALYDAVSWRANERNPSEWISNFALESEFDQVLKLARSTSDLLKSHERSRFSS